MSDPTRAEISAGLRKLADFIDHFDGAEKMWLHRTPYIHASLFAWQFDDIKTYIREAAQAALTVGGTVTEEYPDNGMERLKLRLGFGGAEVHLNIDRDAVCERVEVGNTPVYQWTCPALDGITGEAKPAAEVTA